MKRFEVQPCEGVVSGVWKFRGLTVEKLTEIALGWLEQEPQRYSRVCVRDCGNDQLGIAIRYELAEHQTERQYHYAMTDKLRRQYGNQLVGWDIGQVRVEISQEETTAANSA